MKRVWKVAPGAKAGVWQECLESHCTTLNWLPDADLTGLTKEELGEVLVEHGELKRMAYMIDFFVNGMRLGDIVVANDGLSRVVGIGAVRSRYLHPRHSKNPRREFDFHHHARLVDWKIKDPVVLPVKLFNQPSVQLLRSEQVDAIIKGYGKQYPELRGPLLDLFGGTASVPNGPEQAAEAGGEDDFDPNDVDERALVQRQSRQRRGQDAFRKSLIERYGNRCVMTGCTLLDVLEAAHIKEYRGPKDNHPNNGLLLRADVHTLFDLDLIGIHPNTLGIEIHPRLDREYGELRGKPLRCPAGASPSTKALEVRYRRFRQNKEMTEDVPRTSGGVT